MNIMMTLGGFQFGIKAAAYQELSRSTEYRWPSQDRYMQDAALQYVGPGGDTITLPGVIYPEFNGGTGQMDTLRDLADKGKPLTMISGTGTVMGEWVIERIEDKQSVFAVQGVGRKQEFSLALRKFSSPASETGAGKLVKASELAPLASTPLPNLEAITVSVGSQAGGFAASLTSALQQVTAVGGQITNAASGILSPIQRAIDVATGLKTSAADARSLLGAIPSNLSGISSATRLMNAASSAVNNAGAAGNALRRALSTGTVPDNAVAPVQSAMVTVNQLTVAATKAQSDASTLLKKLIG